MSKLKLLKDATSLKTVAPVLGFKPHTLSYILYKISDAAKYHQFEIPKRSGGKRKISAPCPELMQLQKRLSDLLQDCISEINETRGINAALSHGFRRKHSIITNAAVHRNKRYVFNIDLENFFGTINFGRVRGFFIKNRNFELDPAVATVLSQIACFENALPQGSPCSPVLSNLVTHVLDVHLAQLAFKTGCDYSRYADDITFSTNKPNFPAKLAKLDDGTEHHWQVGKELERIITRAGFTINPAKTRMQFERSRQDVTGLVVNKKVNTRIEYRRTARAMVHRLLKTGQFQTKKLEIDDKGKANIVEVDGTLDQLSGILSFIGSVGLYNDQKNPEKSRDLDAKDEVYRRFLFYKDFYTAPLPVIVCEGKTDNIYIRSAIRRLAGEYPQLVEVDKGGAAKLQVRLYRFTDTTKRLLGLAGGTGNLGKLVRPYKKECAKMHAPGLEQPVILLVDNDQGANGKGGIYGAVKEVTGIKPDGKAPFYFIGENLYLVPTPLKADGGDTMIEDFFEPGLLKKKVRGKTFNPNVKGLTDGDEYGKYIFAKDVVMKDEQGINFDGFKPILNSLVAVIDAHRAKISGA